MGFYEGGYFSWISFSLYICLTKTNKNAINKDLQRIISSTFAVDILGPTVLNHHLNSRLPEIADLPSPQNIQQLPLEVLKTPASLTEHCEVHVCQLCMHSFPTYTALNSHYIAMHSTEEIPVTAASLKKLPCHVDFPHIS